MIRIPLDGSSQAEVGDGELKSREAVRSIFRMSPEERAEIMHKNPPEITSIHGASAYVDWSWMGCGFGQLSFHADPETGRITFMDECMGKDRVRTILHALVDHLVDKGEFDERD
jgi:hypothetical protein